MRKLIFTLSCFLVLSVNGFGQCCPYIDGVEVIPANPSTTDSIYLVTNVTTPNDGEYLGYEIVDMGSTIKVKACYYNGMLTVLESYTDTINLGVKPAGDYDIHFVAYISGLDFACDLSDSTEVMDSVTVTSDLSLPDEPVTPGFYPNPVENGTLYISGRADKTAIKYRLYNIAGKTELQGTLINSNSIDVSGLQGIYFLEMVYQGRVNTEKVFIR